MFFLMPNFFNEFPTDFLNAFYFLPLKLFHSFLVFRSNSCYHQKGSFILLNVHISVGVVPGSQDGARIGEASIS